MGTHACRRGAVGDIPGPAARGGSVARTSAVWIAGLGVFGRRGHPLTRSAVLGLAIGFVGAVLMLIPKGPILTKGSLAQVGVLTACASWSLGTLYYRSNTTDLCSMMFMALQMLMGGLMLLMLALARGDSMHWPPNAPGLISLCYLPFLSSA